MRGPSSQDLLVHHVLLTLIQLGEAEVAKCAQVVLHVTRQLVSVMLHLLLMLTVVHEPSLWCYPFCWVYLLQVNML